MKNILFLYIALLSIFVSNLCIAQNVQNTDKKVQTRYDATAIVLQWLPGFPSITRATGTQWNTSDVIIEYFRGSKGKLEILTETEVNIRTTITNGIIEVKVIDNTTPTKEVLIGITPKSRNPGI